MKIIATAICLLAFTQARAAIDESGLNALFDNNQRAAASFAVESLPSPNPVSRQDMKQAMLQNLDAIQSMFSAQYGPGLYKEGRSGWDLDKQIAAAKREVQSTPNITVAQYHDVLRRFFASTKDYHVSVQFDSTEASKLPFTVISAGGRYFIGWVDRQKLSEKDFPFHPGDEIVGFGGKPTAQVVAGLRKSMGENSPLTDAALAAAVLTSRRAAMYGGVEQGPVAVAIKPKGGDSVVTQQMKWQYTPEMIAAPKFSIASVGPSAAKLPFSGMDNMLSPVQAELATKDLANPFSLGDREGFVPALGKKVWESGADDAFHAYIYQLADGRSVGLVRIPSYEVDNANDSAKAFGELVKRFQKSTDALVIDETNNPGGSVLYLYALASMLTDKPLTTPGHQVAITQTDVAEALDMVKLGPAITTDEQARQALGEVAQGYPVSLDFFKHMMAYSQFIVDQWNKGKTLTDPTFIEGVDKIAPSPTARYTKPILVLINELDFSGGDFFPAIMQDNKRATLFGTRTAGAGGFVRQVQYPNRLGVHEFTMTGSIAVRADGSRIENEGVHADIQYAPTPADAQNGFAGYAAAVNAAVAKLLGPTGVAAAGR